MNLETEFLKNKVQLSKHVLLLMGSIVSIMIFVRLYEHNYVQALADTFFVIIVSYGYYKLTQDEKHFYSVAKTTLVTAFTVALILILKTNDIHIGLLWFTSIIYLTFYYLGQTEGLKWVAMMTLITTLALLMLPNHIAFDLEIFFIWISNIFFIVGIMRRYEKIKENAEKEIIKHQERLTIEIEEKTKELQELNRTLETRIDKEIEKNQKQQQELIERSKHIYIGEMISMLAHQWRQPLAAISSSVNTLKLRNMLGTYDAKYFDERLNRISSYSHELSQTINDFKDFFQTTTQQESSSLAKMTTGVLAIVFPLLEAKDIQIEKSYQSHQRVKTYVNEVQQVILALIQNAIDIIEKNKIKAPKITLNIYQNEQMHILEVSDNAGGVPVEIIDDIFTPYFSTKEIKNKTGLGLYMAKSIIEDHCQGRLEVENTKEGALFRIELPQ
jgi:C4-dicarboxylate-specific signal transduction histidine kinase